MPVRIKSILLILFIFIPLLSFAQSRLFYGRIVNKDNVGIPNSFVKAEKANRSFNCDAKGVFSFSTDVSVYDSLSFYGAGYDKVTIIVDVLPDDSIIIELPKRSNRLQEAIIGAKGSRVIEERAGSGKSIHNAGCYLTFTDEIALFLPVDSNVNGLVNEVNVYITKEGQASTNKFLVHIYEPDSTGAPGNEVTDTTLLLNARRGNEWVRADVSNRKIQTKGGLFVSVEWVIGHGNDPYPWPMYAPSNYYAGNDSLRAFYNSQVLGLTWLDNPKPKVYRRYARASNDKIAPEKWWLTPPLIGGRKRNECITPMINFTYTYLER